MPQQSNDFTELESAVRREIGSGVAAEVALLGQEIADCASFPRMYAEAGRGWRPEWHRAAHRDNCEHCRGAARYGLRRSHARGLWLITEKTKHDRPAWWKAAVADYLSRDATPLMRILSKAQEWTSGVNDAAASWSGLEAAPAFRSADEAEIQSREVDRRFDDATGLRAILFRKEGVEGAPGVYILEVEDLGSGNSARQVVAGIAGKWDLIERSVSLELKDHVCKGAVEIPEAEVAALGGECRLIPAIDTEDGSTVTATS